MPLPLSLLFFLNFCVFPFFFTIFFPSLYLYFLPSFLLLSLFTTMAFYTTCCDRIYHFTPQPLLARCGHPSKIAPWLASCPATTITLCWMHHASFLDKSGLSCFLPLFVFTILIWIRAKPLPHLPLWHAFSGFSLYLLLLSEMSSNRTFPPKEV